MAFAPVFGRVFPATFDRRAAAAGNGLLNNLAAHWTLDEASGATRNDSHGARHLADTDTVPQYASGKINAAAGLFAYGKWLSVANTGLTVPTGGILTISAWCYRDTDGSLSTIASIYQTYPANIQYTLRGTTNSRITIFLRTTEDVELLTANNTFPTGSWHHVIVEINDADKRLRVWINNGTATESAAYSGSPATSTSVFRIGNSGANEPFTGYLDDVAVWTAALTAAQRSALYNAGNGLAYTAFTT